MTRPQDQDARWISHGERPVYENEWITVGLADVEVPSGERFEHHTVTMKPAAMTVVLDDAGEHVLMSWRHRFVPDVWNWELPGGLLDPDETPAETAAREVEEETGYRPRRLEHLVTFEPMIGHGPQRPPRLPRPWRRARRRGNGAERGHLRVGRAGRRPGADRQGAHRELGFSRRAVARPGPQRTRRPGLTR